tara:strand:+ start:642 stop:956 length:315 start_codon:yes stop_codon:yes gene_type:complete
MNFSINQTIFDHIINSPKIFSDNGLTFIYAYCDQSALGFVVSKRLGPANKRNLFKRRCRSLFSDINKQNKNINLGLIVKTTSVDLDYEKMRGSFAKLIKVINSK